MRRLPALLALASIAALIGAAAPSQAGVAPPDEETMVIDPESGPPGTEITVTGEGCATKGDLEVEVVLLDTEDTEQDSVVVEPSSEGFDGEWEATVTVPADTTDFGEWTVDAVCDFADEVALASFGRSAGGGRPPLVLYDERLFTVTQPTPPTSTTTTTTTTPAGGGTAPAAVAAAATPTFTG